MSCASQTADCSVWKPSDTSLVSGIFAATMFSLNGTTSDDVPGVVERTEAGGAGAEAHIRR